MPITQKQSSNDKALSRRIQDALNADDQTRRVVEGVDGVEQVTSRIELTHRPRKADQ